MAGKKTVIVTGASQGIGAAVVTNTQVKFVSTRFASRRSALRKSEVGSTANVTPGVAWKRLIDLTQDDVIRTV
jgi:short-subunit dehydrogenase